MQRSARPAWLLFLFVTACSSAPAPLPEGTGAGLVAFDAAAPASTQVWGPPERHVGDQFALVRGGKQRIEFKVAAITDEGYVLVDGVHNRLKRGRDLSNLGEWGPEGDEPLHLLSPADVRFHWPLWVGKRWRCQYSERVIGAKKAMPVETSYEVEDLDHVVTPAGTFAALRIKRTARLVDADIYDMVSIIWYAPDIGIEVRQTVADTIVELVEWKHAAPTPSSGEPSKQASSK